MDLTNCFTTSFLQSKITCKINVTPKIILVVHNFPTELPLYYIPEGCGITSKSNDQTGE